MHMIDLTLNVSALVAHAASQGNNTAHDEDLGYAVHGWLAESLGDRALQPFRVMEQRGDRLRLLGYSELCGAELRARAQLASGPRAWAAADWDNIASKDLSNVQFQAGQALAFEVRLCPVVRHGSVELDAFLHHLDQVGGESDRSRSAIYRDWLVSRLGDVAELGDFDLKAFRRVSVWRKRREDGARQGRRLERPDALVTGRLIVRDPVQFAELLRRGIGRHKTFGFGMLLVRPT